MTLYLYEHIVWFPIHAWDEVNCSYIHEDYLTFMERTILLFLHWRDNGIKGLKQLPIVRICKMLLKLEIMSDSDGLICWITLAFRSIGNN